MSAALLLKQFFFVENNDGRTGGDRLDPAPVQELGHWDELWDNEFSSGVAQNLKTEIEFTRGGLLAIYYPKAGLINFKHEHWV